MTYMMFEAMELEFRTNFVVRDCVCGSEMKEKVKAQIDSNENVLFYWCIVCAEWEEDTAQILLGMISDLWITIRGFSAVSGWLEQYK